MQKAAHTIHSKYFDYYFWILCYSSILERYNMVQSSIHDSHACVNTYKYLYWLHCIYSDFTAINISMFQSFSTAVSEGSRSTYHDRIIKAAWMLKDMTNWDDHGMVKLDEYDKTNVIFVNAIIPFLINDNGSFHRLSRGDSLILDHPQANSSSWVNICMYRNIEYTIPVPIYTLFSYSFHALAGTCGWRCAEIQV